MGVEIQATDASTYLLCWGDAFGRFGLEPHIATAEETFRNDPTALDVTTHPWWTPFVNAPITAELIWRRGYVDREDAAPVAARLTTSGHALWIFAATRADGTEPNARAGFLLGMDEVFVTADQHLAKALGLLGDPHRG